MAEDVARARVGRNVISPGPTVHLAPVNAALILAWPHSTFVCGPILNIDGVFGAVGLIRS
jgi:hypothetical protein